MKLNITHIKWLTTILLTIFVFQLHAQILCDLGNRNIIHQTNSNREYSGLTYYKNVFFMPIDAPITINNIQRNLVAYDENGTIFYPTFSNPNQLADNDLEGLTYLEQDYFLLVEEDKNDVYFLKYNNGNKTFKILSRHNTDIDLGSTADGLEGIAYDPQNKLLFLVREHERAELFSIPITLPDGNLLGSINIAQKKSVILPSNIFSDNDSNTDNDASGLFHLGKIVDATSELSNNLLILSEGLKKVVEFEVNLDSNNNLNSITYIGEKSLALENQPEGITVYDGKIYIASEVDPDNPNANPATLSSYTLSNNILSCKIVDANCNCLDKPGCIDNAACNYDALATEDDGSCLYTNTSCDDGNPITVNDIRDVNCNCTGEIILGCIDMAACNYDASASKDDGSCLYANTTCDDNNPTTVNDTRDVNCNCVGEVILGCIDDTACNYDASASKDDGSCLYANTSCDDNNPTTVNDTRDVNCNCAGEVILGCIDFAACNFDSSATANDNSCIYPNTPCDDGNANTSNDAYNANCTCVGVETCPTDIIHNGTLSGGIYQVSNSIESTAVVNQNERVDYDAGAFIHLDKGFLADSGEGVYLLAKIEGCTQLRASNLMEQNTSIKNFPNPFNGETTIEFELNSATDISLFVSDINGKQITTLLNNETSKKGLNQVVFDGTHLAQGIYYCTLISDNNVSTQKMILMK